MDTICISIITLSALGLAFGIILSYVSHRFSAKDYPIVEKINELLPQSQCRQCGYPGCLSYAEAIGMQGEKINLCVQGGEAVTRKIASFLNIDFQYSGENKEIKEPVRMLAIIDEPNCIGCTKCIQVCPVDAIIGSAHALHTVMSDSCTGCNLCVTICPTQCIELHQVKTVPNNWKWDPKNIPVRLYL